MNSVEANANWKSSQFPRDVVQYSTLQVRTHCNRAGRARPRNAPRRAAFIKWMTAAVLRSTVDSFVLLFFIFPSSPLPPPSFLGQEEFAFFFFFFSWGVLLLLLLLLICWKEGMLLLLLLPPRRESSSSSSLHFLSKRHVRFSRQSKKCRLKNVISLKNVVCKVSIKNSL